MSAAVPPVGRGSLTEFQIQKGRRVHLGFWEHFHVDGHCAPGVGRQEREEISRDFAGARVEGGEGGPDAGEVFGEHFDLRWEEERWKVATVSKRWRRCLEQWPRAELGPLRSFAASPRRFVWKRRRGSVQE